MKSRSLAPVVASGGGTALRLLVATLAVAAAYFTGTAVTDEPARSVALSSAQSVPAEKRLPAPEPGVLTVDDLADCAYRVRTVADSGAVSYTWTLQRYSPAAEAWQDYLSGTGGFDGAARTVDWRVRVPGNPGLYRAVLDVADNRLISEKFQVDC
ncbi:hypothetical protein [Herbidospora daliensis]|uniref:hypothetical protein n=1 Tax=Herbidospora daliensis TaxID=295585 RepID=UPI0012FC00A5|nr:hypothetical protein [Herbidospora daliensis]